MSAARRSLTVLMLALGWLGDPVWYERTAIGSDVRADERVIFFPTAARWSNDEQLWLAPIHGWVFEPEANSLLRASLVVALRKAMGLDAQEPASAIFRQRLGAFLADNQRGKQVTIVVGAEAHRLPASGPDGHFEGTIGLVAATAQRLASDGRIPFRMLTDAADPRVFAGVVYLVPPTGVTVISDVDDTIKISDVQDKPEMLRNTFLRQFSAVPGMAELYRRWAVMGIQFHFLSNSPWQLYEPLQEFTAGAGFPSATFDLQRFRLKDSSMLNLLADPVEAKRPRLQWILRAYPQRRFILVGDSGERDPEVYGEIARQFPGQVLRVLIRDVTQEPPAAARYQKAFSGLPPELWQLFRDPANIRLPE
jgi:hypothetical protein